MHVQWEREMTSTGHGITDENYRDSSFRDRKREIHLRPNSSLTAPSFANIPEPSTPAWGQNISAFQQLSHEREMTRESTSTPRHLGSSHQQTCSRADGTTEPKKHTHRLGQCYEIADVPRPDQEELENRTCLLVLLPDELISLCGLVHRCEAEHVSHFSLCHGWPTQ